MNDKMLQDGTKDEWKRLFIELMLESEDLAELVIWGDKLKELNDE